MNGTAPFFALTTNQHELHELFNCCLSANYKFVQFVVWKLFHCFDTSSGFYFIILQEYLEYNNKVCTSAEQNNSIRVMCTYNLTLDDHLVAEAEVSLHHSGEQFQVWLQQQVETLLCKQISRRQHRARRRGLSDEQLARQLAQLQRCSEPTELFHAPTTL